MQIVLEVKIKLILFLIGIGILFYNSNASFLFNKIDNSSCGSSGGFLLFINY